MAILEYPKIYGPYQRHVEGPLRNQLIEGAWSRPEIGYLANCEWDWTEKVDGTNIRVHWDGHKAFYGGRTENAQIPAPLIARLDELFLEELFEQQFGENEATLYGEGYGNRIQKAGVNYKADGVDFVLFDVRVGSWWLERDNVVEVASQFGISPVPLVLTGTVDDAIAAVKNGLTSEWGPFEAEGLVGVPSIGLLERSGRRIMVKVKAKDFRALESASSSPG